jgi:ATP-dependent Clp protease adaptor protein ClpS
MMTKKTKMMNKNFIYNQNTDTETQLEEDVLVIEEALQNIILYNDDVNTFDFVIDSLIEVCNHDVIQAEQCTYLVHYAGKCAVKRGTYKKLRPLCEAQCAN